MNVFEIHRRIVDDYSSYIKSFINISDEAIAEVVKTELDKGKLWPKPLLQFNPAFEMSGSVSDVVRSGVLHASCENIFKGYSLYKHQLDAITLGSAGRDFVVTSGTGSGKSLTYIATVFDRLLKQPSLEGVTAIIVYPMNALINSQSNELDRRTKRITRRRRVASSRLRLVNTPDRNRKRSVSNCARILPTSS